MIPEGTWRARGIEGALGYTAGDKEQVAVSVHITDEECEAVGQVLTWYGFFTEKTTESTLKALRTFGWETDDLSDLRGIDANEVFAVVVHEEDEEDGTIRARIRWINATAGGLAMKKRMDEGAAKAFAERMKGHVIKVKNTGPGAKPAAAAARVPAPSRGPARRAAAGGGAATPPPPVDDDNVPF